MICDSKRISARACARASLVGATLLLAQAGDAMAQRGTEAPPVRFQTEARGRGMELAVTNGRGISTPLPGLKSEWQYSDPVLSPDGKRLAFTASPIPDPYDTVPRAPRSDIVVYTLPAGPALHLEGSGLSSLPSWVGNTGDVAYVRRSSPGDTTHSLVVRAADGSGAERVVLSDELVTLRGSSWSADGKTFFVTHEGTRNVRRGELIRFAMDRMDRPERLASLEAFPGKPVVSPDGSMVAWSVAAPRELGSGMIIPGPHHIYVRWLSGGANVQVLTTDGEFPTWSADGTRLFFVAPATRTIMSVRVQSARALAREVPRPVTQRLDAPLYSFAALPGDSLFVIRRRAVAPPSPPVAPEARGVLADSVTQKLLELAAARALVPIAAQKFVDLSQLALDARSYVMTSDAIFAGFAQRIESSLLPFRDENHLIALAAVLGTSGHVADRPGCPASTVPTQCRIQPYAGVVDFSPAVVSADSARVYVHAWTRAATTAAGPGSVSVSIVTRWSFTLARTGVDWAVRRVE